MIYGKSGETIRLSRQGWKRQGCRAAALSMRAQGGLAPAGALDKGTMAYPRTIHDELKDRLMDAGYETYRSFSRRAFSGSFGTVDHGQR